MNNVPKNVRWVGILMVITLFSLLLSGCQPGSAGEVEQEAEAVEKPALTEVPATAAPTLTVEPPTSTPEPTAPPSPTTSAANELAAELDEIFRDYANDGSFSGSVLVAKSDDVIFRGGYGLADRENNIANTTETIFQIASLTKGFTALAIMQLEEEGLLNVTDPICNHLDDCQDGWEDVTIHHLLTHSSGIPGMNPDTYEQIKATPTTPDSLVTVATERPMFFEPGSSFEYSGVGYHLLGLIIEKVSGQPYADYLQENIFDPLGMISTGLEQAPENLAEGYKKYGDVVADDEHMSNSFAAGDIHSTVEDLHLWTRELMYGEKLVSRSTMDTIFSPHVSLDRWDGWGYGYGWWIGPADEPQLVGHDGRNAGYSANIDLLLDDDLAVIILSNEEDVDAEPLLILLEDKALAAE